MAIDYIKIDTGSAGATQAIVLRSFVQALRASYEQGVKVKAVMDHNQDGANWTALEALFGLPATKGQVVYDMVNGAIGAMEGTFQTPDAKNLTERVG
jgi:hypothetical protein